MDPRPQHYVATTHSARTLDPSDPTTARSAGTETVASPADVTSTVSPHAPKASRAGAVFACLFPCLHPSLPAAAPSVPPYSPCLLFGTSAKRLEILKQKGAPHVFSSELSLYEREPRQPRACFPSSLSLYDKSSVAPSQHSSSTLSSGTTDLYTSAPASTPASTPRSTAFHWPGGFLVQRELRKDSAGTVSAGSFEDKGGLEAKASFFSLPTKGGLK